VGVLAWMLVNSTFIQPVYNTIPSQPNLNLELVRIRIDIDIDIDTDIVSAQYVLQCIDMDRTEAMFGCRSRAVRARKVQKVISVCTSTSYLMPNT
jgi:hypothetical protein